MIGHLSDVSHAYRERRRPFRWKQALVAYAVMLSTMWLSVWLLGRAEPWVFGAIATVVVAVEWVWDRRRARRAGRDQGV